MAGQRKAFLKSFLVRKQRVHWLYKATSVPDYVEKIIEASHRHVTFQDWKGFKTMVVHSIEGPTAASWSMTSMLVERLTLLMTGMMKFSGRLTYWIRQTFHFNWKQD
ncbi:hypothetical protein OPV22_015357 [Ensete ventricosum]|uniref:Uncharacterized protein n=1 Tax=Ensete ventricosum TaxID=4639 RepID=A0AAV8RDZ3_ENSVE|nr:hypothetical protein OPV22_015357 [Ensete ventricosum]